MMEVPVMLLIPLLRGQYIDEVEKTVDKEGRLASFALRTASGATIVLRAANKGPMQCLALETQEPETDDPGWSGRDETVNEPTK